MSRLPDPLARAPRTRQTEASEPERLAAILEAGCEELSIHADSQERERLLTYLGLMQRWNRVYNLTAVRDPQAMLVQHVLDSLAVLPWLDQTLAALAPRPDASAGGLPRLVDVGSGAGLPGLVIAISRPALAIDLVEPVGKKAAFLRQCVAELGLAARVRVHDLRVEALRLIAPPELIICRAFASLADYAKGVEGLIGPHTNVLAMKGRRSEIDAEAAALVNGWRLAALEPLRVPGLDGERHLVWLAAPVQ